MIYHVSNEGKGGREARGRRREEILHDGKSIFLSHHK